MCCFVITDMTSKNMHFYNKGDIEQAVKDLGVQFCMVILKR
jgi:hypothetical protein